MPPQREADEILAAREGLGRRLAVLRQAAGYSQRTFAPLTGYGRSTLASVETGHQNVPREFWLRCEDALGAGALVDAYDGCYPSFLMSAAGQVSAICSGRGWSCWVVAG
jgi:transcriptional regulator with XRE-family HTH domain